MKKVKLNDEQLQYLISEIKGEIEEWLNEKSEEFNDVKLSKKQLYHNLIWKWKELYQEEDARNQTLMLQLREIERQLGYYQGLVKEQHSRMYNNPDFLKQEIARLEALRKTP